MNHADLWVVIFLAVLLKLPLFGLLAAIWYAAKLSDRAHEPPPMRVSRISLCGYCGARITVGYDAAEMHRQATAIAGGTGEAPFDVETRLIHAELARPDHFAVEPTGCPGCGESAVWVPIDPLDGETARALEPVRRAQA